MPLRKSQLWLVVIAALISSVVIIITDWAVTSSDTRPLDTLPMATHARSFAYAEIIKPTYTATLTQIPTSLPTSVSIATEIPISVSLVSAEIAVESAPLGYSSTTAQDAPLAISYNGNKRILIDISEQHMYVYEGDVLVNSFVASTGMNNATRVGSFSVLEKIPNAYGATWDIWMPDWLGIYWAGSMQNGIHALPILSNGLTLWEGYLGVPVSYGCVVLGTYEAQVLYDWADVGTPVEIQW